MYIWEYRLEPKVSEIIFPWCQTVLLELAAQHVHRVSPYTAGTSCEVPVLTMTSVSVNIRLYAAVHNFPLQDLTQCRVLADQCQNLCIPLLLRAPTSYWFPLKHSLELCPCVFFFFSFFLRFVIISIHLYPVLGLKEYTLKYKTIFSPKSLVGCSFLTLRLGNNPQPLIAQLFLVHKPVVLSFWDFVTNRALQNQAQSLIIMDV